MGTEQNTSHTRVGIGPPLQGGRPLPRTNGPIGHQFWRPVQTARMSKGRRPLGEAWLCVGAIIAEFNITRYGVAR